MRLPTQGPEPVPGPPPADLPTDLRVLVVDDDPLCLMIVAKMLRRCNYEGATPSAPACLLCPATPGCTLSDPRRRTRQ